MKKILPILIDMDGVIRLGSSLAKDAAQLLNFLNDEKLPFFILTNSTRESGNDMKNYLSRCGIAFPVNVMTTVDATIEYLKEKKLTASVYCVKNVRNRFNNYIDDNNPDAVVIGDLGTEWTYEILNRIFNQVHNGAEIIAMQKNKFWKPDGIHTALDAGAFITAVEFASGKTSTLIGKPSPVYFNTALKMLGFNTGSPFLMIGDDIGNDINPAQKLGGKGILVCTGKTKFPLAPDLKIQPDYASQNLTEVIDLLKDILSN